MSARSWVNLNFSPRIDKGTENEENVTMQKLW